jgi:Cryptococcal mannosyltransferase 1
VQRGQPKDRFEKYFNAREDLFNDRLFAIKSVSSVCVRVPENGTMWPHGQARYPTLGMDENANLEHKYYFGLMLRNSATHLPTIADNLLRVFYHLGEQNVFLSIFEGGSTDEGHTTAMIEPFKKLLDATGIEYHIEFEDHVTPDLLNGVLRPLKEMYRATQRVFHSVVMMGDDLWCAEELLELLFQSRGQAASITCSTDVRIKVRQEL